ncbi:TMEM164-related integral membrane acyltransferase [Jeotgalibacillus aurantiacus]|uniref:TMEM164-related integral membrane acyltransferase n=1 Tax=Jeotgalibacillus aurantiacus TaxID=2763266 RepID=UPI001D0AB185|nr:TIGR02206 family membrane protein [Jeotgalibacillus aurantiacus]
MFQAVPDERFILFSFEHMVVLALFLIALISGLKIFLRPFSDRSKKFYTNVFIVIFILSELSYQIWAVSAGIWRASNYLPFQLCSFSTFFGIFLLLKRNTSLFYFYFYIAFFPPLFALITPDLIYSFPHYFFFKFFIQHIAIPLSAVFLLARDQYELPPRSIWIAFILLNITAACIALVNRITGGNYFFLQGPPVSNTVLSFLGKGVFYILSLELLAVLLFTLTWFIGSKMISLRDR